MHFSLPKIYHCDNLFIAFLNTCFQQIKEIIINILFHTLSQMFEIQNADFSPFMHLGRDVRSN